MQPAALRSVAVDQSIQQNEDQRKDVTRLVLGQGHVRTAAAALRGCRH
jgi:hypothetical protein